MATSRNDPRITAAIDGAMAWMKSQVGKARGDDIWAIAYPQWVKTGYHWCGGFPVAAYKQVGVDLMKCAWWFYTPYIKNFAVRIGAWKAYGADYGDQPLFDWNRDGVIDHVGNAWPDPASVYYRSVEGNTSPGTAGSQSNGGGVWVRHRERPVIAGWADMRRVLAYMIDTGLWDGTLTGTVSTPNINKPPVKGTIVKQHYHREDKTARNGGRILGPGKHFYLHIETGKQNSQASNVIGGIGPYSLTSHLYATGTPGDTVDLVYVFGVDGKNSNHYVERAEIGADGTVRRNAEFKRAAAAGTSVYLRAVAGEKNKAPVKITVLDSDAYLFATA